MKLRLFYISLLACTILLSCEKEKGIPIDNENMPLLWKEIYAVDLYFEYTYNDANLLYERKTKWSYTSYSYNDDHQLVSYDMYDDWRMASSNWDTLQAAMNRTDWVTPENTKISGRGTYSYNQNKLTKITVTRLPSGTANYVTFEYDKNGKISKQTFFSNNQPSGFLEYGYDERGNLILVTHKDLVNGSPVVSVTEQYEFDDKNNPYKAFKRLLQPGECTNENNIIKKTMTLFFDAPGVDKIQVTESTYEYNLQDYPVKKGNTVSFEYK
jgi:antitoxin component YwqK of YwqJK toxin-antitoxin module